MPKVIVFDCDGTLLDTLPIIKKSVISTFQDLRPELKLTDEEVMSFFGPLLTDSFSKYVTKDVSIDQYVNTYRMYGKEYSKTLLKAFDGIEDALKELKTLDVVIGIASNKVTEAVESGLIDCNINQYFDFIFGADKMIYPKPDKHCLEIIKQSFDINNLILIGDTPIDIMTAKNADCLSVGVCWCKTTKETFEELKADAIAETPYELIEKLKPLINEL